MHPHICTIASLLIISFLNIGILSNVEANQFNNSDAVANETLQSNPHNRSYARQTPSQQRAVIQNQRIKQSLARRGGFLVSIGNITLGGILGILIFGGAFENLKAIDFGVLGLIGFVVYQINAWRVLKR